MLDLEKKVDAKFIDQKQDTAKAIVTALDVSNFRRELEAYVDDRILGIEKSFDQIYGRRANAVEEKLDEQIQEMKAVIDWQDEYGSRVQENELNLKDTVDLIKTLDNRMLSSNK